jgi:hypothetical protein
MTNLELYQRALTGVEDDIEILERKKCKRSVEDAAALARYHGQVDELKALLKGGERA